MIKTKNKMLKQVCILGLSATMLAGMVMPFADSIHKNNVEISADTSSDGEFKYEGRTYKYKNDGSNIKLMSVTGDGQLTIPSKVTIGGKTRTVTGLGDYFGYNPTFSKVTVPNTVTKIDTWVFCAAKVDSLVLSSNLESIGVCFCYGATVKAVSCNSRKISEIDGIPFFEAKCPKAIALGDWVVKYEMQNNVIDFSTSALAGAVKIHDQVKFDFGGNKGTIKFGNDKMVINRKDFVNGCYKDIKDVYVNGTKVVCKSATDTVPTVVQKNYDIFDMSTFSLNYSKDKAKYILNSLGLQYFGLNNKVKGTFSANKEFLIALAIHDYVTNNYVYDTAANGTFSKVLNCHTKSKCSFDGQMYAFLLECAGVEAETVSSGELIPVTEAQKKQYEKEGKKYSYTINGKYRIGKNGNHLWTLIKIGGKWYHADATTDRQINGYGCFLVSNDFDNTGIHCFPYYTEYHNDIWAKEMFGYQDRSTMLQTPKATNYLGDLDMSGTWYRDERDRDMLSAYILLSKDIREKFANAKNGIVSISDAEAKKANAGFLSAGKQVNVKLVEKVNGKWKLLIDPTVADMNFDGEVNVADMVIMNKFLYKKDPSKKD